MTDESAVRTTPSSVVFVPGTAHRETGLAPNRGRDGTRLVLGPAVRDQTTPRTTFVPSP